MVFIDLLMIECLKEKNILRDKSDNISYNVY